MDTVYIFFENDNVRIPFYDYDKNLFNQFKKSRLGYWVQDERHYRISRSSYDPDKIKAVLEGRPFVEVGKEAVNQVVVHSFILGGPQVPEEIVQAAAAALVTCPIPENQADGLPCQFPGYLLEKLEIEMRSRKFSHHTRSVYTSHNKALCQWLQKQPEEVNSDDIKRYLAFLDQVKKQSAATLNSALSAFKFFYRQVLKRDTAREQKRPRQDKRLPVVMSKTEVMKILESACNPKHRLLLMIGFASGLRVSELVNLRRQNVDLSRKTIRVVDGKGRKDRETVMSESAYILLKFYFSRNKISGWIFPGADPAKHLSVRTAQHVFKNALKRAKIEKSASIHSLRHSFATHLLERGVDITYIKELLGHGSIRTTERYTHVARRKSLKIVSPMDTIDQDDGDGEDNLSEKEVSDPKYARWLC